MTGLLAVAVWTFVQSSTYAIVSGAVGVVAVLLLVILVIQQELQQVGSAHTGPRSHPRMRVVATPLVLCFAVIAFLRLAGIAYDQSPSTSIAATAHEVPQAPARPARSSGQGAVSMPSQFYIAGGVSSARESSFVDLVNPGAQAAGVQLTFFYGDGRTDMIRLTVPPESARVVPAASVKALSGDFGLRIAASQQLAAQLRIVRAGRDGDVLPGSAKLSTTWYLAEGSTSMTFRESVSILNPDPRRVAHAMLRLRPETGQPPRDVMAFVPPHTQIVLNVNSLAPDRAIGMIVNADLPVCVTRTLTFGDDGHGLTTQVGSAEAATHWSVATGTTTRPFETYLLALNPGTRTAHATVRFYGTDGTSLGRTTLLIDASKRLTLRVNDMVIASGFSTVIDSDQPIVVEQAEYTRAPNGSLSAGTVVRGSSNVANRMPTTGRGAAAGTKP